MTPIQRAYVQGVLDCAVAVAILGFVAFIFWLVAG